jgi:hypothetical protein
MRGDNEQLLIQADNLIPATTGVKSQAVKGRHYTHSFNRFFHFQTIFVQIAETFTTDSVLSKV